MQSARPRSPLPRSMKANVSVTCTDNQILISEGKDLTSPSMSLLLLISTFVTEPNFENLQ